MNDVGRLAINAILQKVKEEEDVLAWFISDKKTAHAMLANADEYIDRTNAKIAALKFAIVSIEQHSEGHVQ